MLSTWLWKQYNKPLMVLNYLILSIGCSPNVVVGKGKRFVPCNPRNWTEMRVQTICKIVRVMRALRQNSLQIETSPKTFNIVQCWHGFESNWLVYSSCEY